MLRRVDFLGVVFLCISIVCGLLVLDLGGQRMPWTDPKILLLLGASVMALNVLVFVETAWAKESIFPLRLLLHRDTEAQGAMIVLIPLYFQVPAHVTHNAGAHLMPSVIGNAIGGLLADFVIKRTGRYKLIAVIGVAASSTSYNLMILRWHGNISFLESLCIIPGGFGNVLQYWLCSWLSQRELSTVKWRLEVRGYI
ncbi:uncharacterized protein K444DRAFT_663170 [Hyaloscypha bicolor E]|uniref:MFS general substrate transporter n=1 Tax=Hyaloscypha bicolor E TaxID=1095630 RepID=A0A2J6TBC6_9HELO|nr:uncharacterized protein K444DRAFT_663170 [Hyaloscypha bicolor E]PMD60334.1 hypothetical protein K444DRAFT_663170 [Hyaloscypha bicolor E]